MTRWWALLFKIVVTHSPWEANQEYFRKRAGLLLQERLEGVEINNENLTHIHLLPNFNYYKQTKALLGRKIQHKSQTQKVKSTHFKRNESS